MGESFLITQQILGAQQVVPQSDATYPLISETQAGEILVKAAPGTLDIAMTSPAYAGQYGIDLTALAAGPVNLVPPAIVGDAGIGRTLTATPGLWSHDGTLAAPALARQWLRDDVAIAGATGADYVTTSADHGRKIRLAETAQDAHGSATAVSTVLAMPELLVPLQRSKTVGATTRVFAGLDLGAPAAMRDIVVLAAASGTAGAVITEVTVAGVAATRLAQVCSGGSAMVCIGAYLARVPVGSVGDVAMTTSLPTPGQHVALLRGEDLRLAASVVAAVSSGAAVTMTTKAGRPGSRVLGFAANNNGTAFDWTGGTELYDEDIQTGKFVSAAMGDVGPDGRAGCTARRVSGSGQIAGLMIAF